MPNPYQYEHQVAQAGVDAYFAWNYRKAPNFWCQSNALEPASEAMSKHIPPQGKSDVPGIELTRLIFQMYYDFYNNGGGNTHRWAISKDFRRAMVQCKIPEEDRKRMGKHLSEIYNCMGRGSRFGWPSQGAEGGLGYHLECLITDAVYFSALLVCPESLDGIPHPEQPKQAS